VNLTYIYVKNFLSYKEASLKFDEDNLYLLIGKNFQRNGSSNGSGKSSLREAIVWGLFGESRFGSKNADELIKRGEKEAEVIVGFSMSEGGKEYLVKRSKKRNGTTKLNCNSFTGQTLKETQDYIQNLLGMDYDTFKNSACFEQGAADSFSKLTPKEAKEVVIRLLQLGIYEKLYSKAKMKLSEASHSKVTYSSQLSLLEHSGDSDESSLKSEEVSKGLELSSLENTEKALSSRILNLDSELTEYQMKKEEIKNKIVEFERAKITPVITRLNDLKREKSNLQALGDKGNCPTCKQQVTQEYLTEAFSVLNNRIANGEEIYKKFTLELDAMKLSFTECCAPSSTSTEYNTTKDKLARLGSRKVTLSNEIGVIQGKLAECQKRRGKIQELRDKMKEAEEKYSIYEKLTKAFSKDGIPAFIIENTKPEIEEIANSILQPLTDGRLKISIETEKELKSGKSSDTLDILITDGLYTRPYLSYSGGEKFLIDFCTRTALSAILSNRHKAKIQTLIIDEGLGSLDDDNRKKFMAAVQQVMNRFSFKKCFLITHATDIQDFFVKKIVIVKDDKGSRIEGEKIEKIDFEEKEVKFERPTKPASLPEMKFEEELW